MQVQALLLSLYKGVYMFLCCGKTMRKWGRAGSGNQRWQCGQCGKRTTNPGEYVTGYSPDLLKSSVSRIRNSKAKTFIITSAQNNAKPHEKFLKSLELCAKDKGAELIIIPVHYKNISLYTASQEYKKSWDASLEKYLVDEKIALGGNVTVMGGIKISATAAHPLAGKEAIGGAVWTIFGHSQVSMRSVASPPNKTPKRCYTTGSVTRKSYSKTNEGAKAEFHHAYGALVVEVVGTKAFIRQLAADNTGGFYDLDKYYHTDGVGESPSVTALVTGDEHVKFNSVKKPTYTNKDSIAKTLKPKYCIRHDVLDSYAVSHHHERDPLIQYKKHISGDNCIKRELNQVASFINDTTPKESTTVIVGSNHNDHLYDWLNRADPNKDFTNARLIHDLRAKQIKATEQGSSTDPLEIFLTPKLNCKFKFLNRNQAFNLHGVEFSQHGDRGPNGSKGTAAGLAKTTYKLVIGHSHTPCIEKGVYQVGTSTGQLEYAKGLSSWANTHVIQYSNGKLSLIDIIGGKWHG